MSELTLIFSARFAWWIHVVAMLRRARLIPATLALSLGKRAMRVNCRKLDIDFNLELERARRDWDEFKRQIQK